NAGPLRRASRAHATHQHALHVLQAHAFGEIGAHVLHRDAQLPTPRLSVFAGLRHGVLRHVRRHGAADADVAPPVGRTHLRVDADQLTTGVHEGAARIAAIDRRIGLQKIFESTVAQIRLAAFCADDTGGDRFTDTQRIPDSEANVADANLI